MVVPVSGGKDSSTVAHKLKYQYSMRHLYVNVSHGIKGLLPLNDINLHNFIERGFDCVRIYMNNTILQYIDKFGLINYGQPILGWLTSMTIVPLKVALLHKVPLIMYAEDGETEYGGSHQMDEG